MTETGLQRLPGFRDFPPEDFAFRDHIVEAWRRVSRRYGFSEYDGPPLEPLDLYVAKSGEEIVDQLYAFADRAGRDVALRPEMTPSLARILGERSRGMSKPIRWFCTPQLFRYERQQRGRLKEHFQWNADIVGEAGVMADAEVLALAVDGLRALGLREHDVCARVSDRKLLTAVVRACGVSERRTLVAFGVIDKLGRERRESSVKRLEEEAGMDAERAASLLEMLEAPGLEGVATAFADHDDVAAEMERLAEYRTCLDAMGLGAYVEFDLSIVRGLAYYTGIVFELFDRRGELRAICGGGRYDRLLELVGGEPLPAVGFGMGDVVLGELLTDKGLRPHEADGLDYFIVRIDAEQRGLAMTVAHALRDRGSRVAYTLREQSVRRQFAAAGNRKALEVIVLGPDEIARGVATVRDMSSGEEREVALADLGVS